MAKFIHANKIICIPLNIETDCDMFINLDAVSTIRFCDGRCLASIQGTQKSIYVCDSKFWYTEQEVLDRVNAENECSFEANGIGSAEF